MIQEAKLAFGLIPKFKRKMNRFKKVAAPRVTVFIGKYTHGHPCGDHFRTFRQFFKALMIPKDSKGKGPDIKKSTIMAFIRNVCSNHIFISDI